MQKYSEIENSYRVKFIEQIKLEGLSDGLWVVHEKIHGSNLSIVVDDSSVRFASRTQFIEDLSQFYGLHEHSADMEKFGRAVFEIVSKLYGAKNVYIFGEYCGGSYNHPDVPKQNVKTIQKGVYYSPQHEFFVFDICLDGTYMNTSAAEDVVNAVGIFRFAPKLFCGTFKQCLEYPNDSLSRVSEILGLPPIEGNISEGVVIKPIVPRNLANGSRVILKNKNDKFKEGEATVKTHEIPVLSESLTSLVDMVKPYVTPNRVKNVASHFGELSFKDFAKLHRALIEDARKDYIKDGITEESLSNDDAKKFGKIFGGLCASATKAYLDENTL